MGSRRRQKAGGPAVAGEEEPSSCDDPEEEKEEEEEEERTDASFPSPPSSANPCTFPSSASPTSSSSSDSSATSSSSDATTCAFRPVAVASARATRASVRASSPGVTRSICRHSDIVKMCWLVAHRNTRSTTDSGRVLYATVYPFSSAHTLVTTAKKGTPSARAMSRCFRPCSSSSSSSLGDEEGLLLLLDAVAATESMA